MANSYSDTPFLVKGMLIKLTDVLVAAWPTIIGFQFNPETINRSFEVWQASGRLDDDNRQVDSDGRVQPVAPAETFSLTLELDAHDIVDGPGSRAMAVLVGVAERLAALEMLLYPPSEDGGLLGTIAGAIGGLFGSDAEPVPPMRVPVVLLIWGPGRVVPVRLTSFAVEEQQFNAALYPVKAKVTVGIKVLSSADLTGDGFSEKVARAAFEFTKTQKEVLALLDTDLLGNGFEVNLPF